MQVQITSTNLDLTKSMQTLAQKKLSKLQKYFADTPDDLVSVRLVLNKSSADDMFKAKIDMDVGKTDIYGESVDFSLETAVIKVVDDILRQYKKVVTKKNGKEWQESRELKRFPVDSPVD